MGRFSRRSFIQGTSAVAIATHGNAFAPLLAEGLRQSATTARTPLKDGVVSGKFGNALDAAWSAAESAQAITSYKTIPFTVEFWCKLDPKPFFHQFIFTHNMLVANGPRESADHWAIYIERTVHLEEAEHDKLYPFGTLCAYWPGITPDVIRTSKGIADGQWHYIAMVADSKTMRLYVDGEEEARVQVSRKAGGTAIAGRLTVGKANLANGGTLDFNGAIDDLRLSNVAREVRGVPTAPLLADEHTIGLWSFDNENAGDFADASPNANPMQVSMGKSLDEIERAGYKADPSPLGSPAQIVPLEAGAATTPAVASIFSLDGQWQLVEGAMAAANKPIPAVVPGSVHTALYEAGLIPSPYQGRNQEIAARWSQKTFWYQKTFPRPPAGQDQTLVFHGICNRCTVWLNGKELGQHEGMFTRAEFSIHELLKDSNVLVVKLDPAIDWKKTLVPNIFYGPFYINIPPLGIWRSVEIRGEPSVKMRAPFIATRDAKTGLMDLVSTLAGAPNGWSGRLVGVISPNNFSGQSYTFEYQVTSTTAEHDLHLQFNVPDPQLWWPVDLGKPNLYRLTLAFVPSNDADPDVQQKTFGIRTVRMAPLDGKPRPRLYNWTFVVNGKPVFVKGSTWSTPDALMDFSRSRYERFLTMAAGQHIQMLRVWGYGMVETDDFYDVCDRLGIMVMQEWPTTWNSHDEQPFTLLEEAVRENTVRLRNHPSLVMYTGGNETVVPFGPAIDMMGRLNIELDDTRPFHRTDPRGGSVHDYTDTMGIDAAFTTEAMFFGEVGYSLSYPNYESVQRMLPANEKNLWPAPSDGALAYLTEILKSPSSWKQTLDAAQYFTAAQTMDQFVVGTQLAHAVGVRHLLERARTRWPQCTGALYFKFNEIAPTAERSSVDWFGSPKIPYYLIQNSLAPLLAVAVFPKSTTHGEALTLPVFLLDDADALHAAKWEVTLWAYGSDLKPIKISRFAGVGSVKRVTQVGEFSLTAQQTKTVPLLVVTEVRRNGELAKRNYYVTNFAPVKDCLFHLPKTTVSVHRGDRQLIVRNEGKVPAVGVNVSRPGHGDTFFSEENYFWLNPGESKNLAVSTTEGVVAQGWNL